MIFTSVTDTEGCFQEMFITIKWSLIFSEFCSQDLYFVYDILLSHHGDRYDMQCNSVFNVSSNINEMCIHVEDFTIPDHSMLQSDIF